MNAPSCSDVEAELQVLEVLRQLHPEWMDADGGCQACLLYSIELAASTSLAASEFAAQPQPEPAAAGSAATDIAEAMTPPPPSPSQSRGVLPLPECQTQKTGGESRNKGPGGELLLGAMKALDSNSRSAMNTGWLRNTGARRGCLWMLPN